MIKRNETKVVAISDHQITPTIPMRLSENLTKEDSPWEKTYTLLKEEIELRHYSRKNYDSSGKRK
jgi:hypothetical protein